MPLAEVARAQPLQHQLAHYTVLLDPISLMRKYYREMSSSNLPPTRR